MAEGLSNNLRTLILKAVKGDTVTIPVGAFAGLSTVDPGDDGSTNSEPTFGTGDYQRLPITWATVVAPAAGADAVLENSAALEWTADAAYSTGTTELTYVTVWTSASGTTAAEFVCRMALDLPSAMNANGAQIRVLAGELEITLGVAA